MILFEVKNNHSLFINEKITNLGDDSTIFDKIGITAVVEERCALKKIIQKKSFRDAYRQKFQMPYNVVPPLKEKRIAWLCRPMF